MRRLLRSLALALCLLVTGCQHNPTAGLLVTRSSVEKQLNAIQADHAAAMAALREEQAAVTGRLLAAKDAQLSGAANAFYGQDYVWQTLPTQSRNDRVTVVWHNLTLEGWKATGDLMPDYATMKRIQDRLQKDLDEKQTSLEQLQSTHAQVMSENQALADTTRQFQEQLAALAAKQQEAEAQFQARLDAKQAELNEVNARLIAAADDKAARDAARQAQLNRLSWGAGIIAALCLAGAIWSPVAKRELGLGALIFAGAAVAIPFVEGWQIIVVAGLALGALTVWALVKYRREERVADALVLAVQDVKEKTGDVWDKHVRPAVEDRLSAYHKTKDGKMVVEKDPKIEAFIDGKLAEWDAK